LIVCDRNPDFKRKSGFLFFLNGWYTVVQPFIRSSLTSRFFLTQSRPSQDIVQEILFP